MSASCQQSSVPEIFLVGAFRVGVCGFDPLQLENRNETHILGGPHKTFPQEILTRTAYCSTASYSPQRSMPATVHVSPQPRPVRAPVRLASLGLRRHQRSRRARRPYSCGADSGRGGRRTFFVWLAWASCRRRRRRRARVSHRFGVGGDGSRCRPRHQRWRSGCGRRISARARVGPTRGIGGRLIAVRFAAAPHQGAADGRSDATGQRGADPHGRAALPEAARGRPCCHCHICTLWIGASGGSCGGSCHPGGGCRRFQTTAPALALSSPLWVGWACASAAMPVTSEVRRWNFVRRRRRRRRRRRQSPPSQPVLPSVKRFRAADIGGAVDIRDSIVAGDRDRYCVRRKLRHRLPRRRVGNRARAEFSDYAALSGVCCCRRGGGGTSGYQ